MFTVGEGDNKTIPIHQKNLAWLCVQKIEAGEKEIPAGGPQLMSRSEIAQQACISCECKAHVHIPKANMGLALLLLPFVNQRGLYDKLAFYKHVFTNDVVAPA